MVSGRAAAALGVRAVLAQGRQADLAEPGADRGRGQHRDAVERRRASVHRIARASPRRRRPRTCCRRSRTPPTGCSRKARCRPMSIRPIPRSTTRSSARASCASSSGFSRRRPATCCRCSVGPRKRVPAGSASCGSCAARRLFLVPGDAPIGLRLPLNSLPYIAPKDEPRLVPADPFAERGALPDPALHRAPRGKHSRRRR